MSRSVLAGIVCTLWATSAAMAADRWVVNGEAFTPTSAGAGVRWVAGSILHNVGDAPATVRLVGGSAGAFPGPVTAIIPAGQSVGGAFAGLAGTPRGTLWVTHLDVPSTLRVEGRLELWFVETFPGRPPPASPFTKLSMPVFERLIPAGEEQFHFGTDLGGQRFRINVAIYNGASVPAQARIALHAPLCSAVLVEQTVLIGANEIVQVPLKAPETCPGSAADAQWVRSVRVSVDQPSFSFVSVLSNEFPPNATSAVVSSDR